MPLGDSHFSNFIASRKKSPPSILYKYTTLDTARSILDTEKLRFQSPLQYNDPFDVQWDIAWPRLTPEAKLYESALIESAFRDSTVWPDDASLEFKHAMEMERIQISNLPVYQQERAIADFVKNAAETHDIDKSALQDLQQRLRIFCMSENCNSLLMWSHYANMHRGVAFGFDASILENRLQRPLAKVRYSDSLPQITDFKQWISHIVFGLPGSPPIQKIEEWALAKHSDWKYENEWRFVTVASKGVTSLFDDLPFPRESLVELVFGCEAAVSESTSLASQARKISPSIRQYRMQKHPCKFKLCRVKVK